MKFGELQAKQCYSWYEQAMDTDLCSNKSLVGLKNMENVIDFQVKSDS